MHLACNGGFSCRDPLLECVKIVRHAARFPDLMIVATVYYPVSTLGISASSGLLFMCTQRDTYILYACYRRTMIFLGWFARVVQFNSVQHILSIPVIYMLGIFNWARVLFYIYTCYCLPLFPRCIIFSTLLVSVNRPGRSDSHSSLPIQSNATSSATENMAMRQKKKKLTHRARSRSLFPTKLGRATLRDLPILFPRSLEINLIVVIIGRINPIAIEINVYISNRNNRIRMYCPRQPPRVPDGPAL